MLKNIIESHQAMTSNKVCLISYTTYRKKHITLDQFCHDFIQRSQNISTPRLLSIRHMFTAPDSFRGTKRLDGAVCKQRS